MSALSEKERDTALAAVAIVRLALQSPPEVEVTERLNFLIDDREGEELASLIFRLGDLTATILEAWHSTMKMIIAEPVKDQLDTPEQLLDKMVRVIVEGPPKEK